LDSLDPFTCTGTTTLHQLSARIASTRRKGNHYFGLDNAQPLIGRLLHFKSGSVYSLLILLDTSIRSPHSFSITSRGNFQRSIIDHQDRPSIKVHKGVNNIHERPTRTLLDLLVYDKKPSDLHLRDLSRRFVHLITPSSS